jgi:hypothetical protein
MKRNGGEPTYSLICGSCPEAVKNPETENVVDKKRVYDVFRESCYDDGADEPWKHRSRLTKSALPEDVIEKRLKWQGYMMKLDHSSDWYYKNLVWFDLCNTILPRSQKKAAEQALARKGGKSWISEGCQEWSSNLGGKKDSLKQKSWDTIRVWWMPVLTRGKLHLEVFLGEFAGENPEGAEQAAQRLRPILNIRFPNESQPKIVMTDRGKGFYHPFTAKITKKYKAGLESVGLKPFMGDDASEQPGTMGDLMLHETAVAWVRLKIGRSTPAQPWLETPEQFKARMQQVCREVNAEYEVENLCRELPSRLKDLKDRGGDKLKK